eukprot:TRINITY_DN4996_c0_g2_i1.p1 TRINITY_DN4996_c0_g2~~TRINITY_DN4996_c0_g2_i1.p1  ORF type:complete len:515 (+),score=18.49 TRINITY_DN4996_c0_g2_i1:11-1555(+)
MPPRHTSQKKIYCFKKFSVMVFSIFDLFRYFWGCNSPNSYLLIHLLIVLLQSFCKGLQVCQDGSSFIIKTSYENQFQLNEVNRRHNSVGKYLGCGMASNVQDCVGNGNEGICNWVNEDFLCTINQDEFRKLFLNCENQTFEIADDNQRLGSNQKQELECDALNAIWTCLKLENQNDLRSLQICELREYNSDNCTSYSNIEFAMLLAKNVPIKNSRLWKLKGQILNDYLISQSIDFESDDMEEVYEAVPEGDSDRRNTSLEDLGLYYLPDISSNANTLPIFWFLIGVLVIAAMCVIGYCGKLCREQSENNNEQENIRVTIWGAQSMNPRPFQQQRYSTIPYSTQRNQSGESALRMYYARQQAEQGARLSQQLRRDRERVNVSSSSIQGNRARAYSSRGFQSTAQSLAASSSYATQVNEPSLNDQLWWSGQVPLQSHSKSSALEQFIQSLQVFLYRQSQSQGEVCTVCLEDMEDESQVIALPCCHIFHAKCIIKWIRTKGVTAACPVCNARLLDDF